MGHDQITGLVVVVGFAILIGTLWAWSRTREGGSTSYRDIGDGIAIIVAAITFIGTYIYCAATYGFLFGFGLGWLPSAILAAMVAFVVRFLWGPILVVIGCGLVYLATVI